MERGLAVAAEVTPGANLRTDPDLLDQVLLNLQENAGKYTPDRGEVRLRATRLPVCPWLLHSQLTEQVAPFGSTSLSLTRPEQGSPEPQPEWI